MVQQKAKLPNSILMVCSSCALIGCFFVAIFESPHYWTLVSCAVYKRGITLISPLLLKVGWSACKIPDCWFVTKET
jgi:hypothetical protein